MLTKAQLLEPLARIRTNEVVVTTMGIVRPWADYSESALDFASADSAMGHAADLALGVAIAQPSRRVICLNGDGSMLMTLGTLVTIVESGVTNLILFVVENGTYEITGNQPVPGAGRIDYAMMAKAAGFPRVFRFTDPVDYAESLASVLDYQGPTLVVVAVEPGTEPPISRGAPQDAPYLRTSLEACGKRLRELLMSSGSGA